VVRRRVDPEGILAQARKYREWTKDHPITQTDSFAITMSTIYRDTTPEAEAILLDLLRQASPARKLQMVNRLNASVYTLMRAGLRQRYPQDDDAAIRGRLAVLLVGDELASSVEDHTERRGNWSPALGRHLEQQPMNEDAVDVTLKVIAVLERCNIPYVMVGSLAGAVHGVSRSTLDSDLLAAIRPVHIDLLVEALETEFYVSAPAIAEAIAHHSSFNVIHLSALFKVDIFVAKPRPFDQAELHRGQPLVVAHDPDRVALVASPEDTILAKLEWFRAGGEVSENQWRDVLSIIQVQGDRLDLVYLRQTAVELQIEDLLEKALNTQR
jgi:hypothetical protein